MSAEYTFRAEQNADWSRVVQWLVGGIPQDLTGYSATLTVNPIDSTETGLLVIDTDTGGIVITPLTGTLTISATIAQLAILLPGTYQYTLQVINTLSVITELLNGLFFVDDGISVP